MAVTIKFSEDFDMNKQKTYKIGDTFYHKEYGPTMLVSTESRKVMMVVLRSGERWSVNTVKVNDIYDITEEEFNEICDGHIVIPINLEIKVFN